MWDSEVSLVQRSPSLVLTCAALPWLLQSSYTPLPLPPAHPTNPTPTATSYGTRARLQDQPGVVWSNPGEAQSLPQSHANRYHNTTTDPLTGVCAQGFLMSRF